MKQVDPDINQATLDSLRSARTKLFAVPEKELDAMSSDDQVKYGDELHQLGLAILKLEAAQLKGVNDAFKAEEGKLKDAAASLEADAAKLKDSLAVIRAISEGLSTVTNVISLLAK